MGGTTSDPVSNRQGSPEQHPLLGDVQRFQVPSDGFRLEWSIVINNESQVKNWVPRYESMIKKDTKQLLFLPVSYQFTRSGICSKSGILKLVFQDFLFSLDVQLENRREISKLFTEVQMWYILVSLAEVGRLYTSTDRRIGNINPTNIVIDHNGCIQVASWDSWPSRQLQFYESSRLQQRPQSYLAPEQIYKINNRDYILPLDKNAIDMFAIGMTLLEAATLQDSLTVYNPVRTINQQVLLKKLQKVQRSYSSHLSFMIASCLSLDPATRPTCGQILAVSSPYASKIQGLQQFNFDFATSESQLNSFRSIHSNQGSKWVFKKLLQNRSISPRSNIPGLQSGQKDSRIPNTMRF